MMTQDDRVTRLSDQMCAFIERTPQIAALRPLLRPIAQTLAYGRPVRVEDLAEAVGRSPATVRHILRRVPLAEWSTDRRLVGLGLALRPTPHRFVARGRDLYVWGATDALVFAAILGEPVRIESSCRVTGTPISIDISSAGVERVEPAVAAMSVIATTEDLSRVIMSIYGYQCFFRSLHTAGVWQTRFPDHEILPVRDGFEYARRVARMF